VQNNTNTGSGCSAPSITIVDPRAGFSITEGTRYVVKVNPTSRGTIQRVDISAANANGKQASTSLTRAPWEWTWDTLATGQGKTTLTAGIVDDCTSAGTSINGVVTPFVLAPPDSTTGAVLLSALELPDAQGRVVVNGAHGAFVRADGARPAEHTLSATNRVEALLVAGKGAGRWTFHVRGGAIRPGSFQVMSGDVVLVTSDTVVFRIGGTPGERIAFAFDTER
jgi:hypothetical protein